MFLSLELKLFIFFAVFAVVLNILLLTVLVISKIDNGFQFRVSRLHIFSLVTKWKNLSCWESTYHVMWEINWCKKSVVIIRSQTLTASLMKCFQAPQFFLWSLYIFASWLPCFDLIHELVIYWLLLYRFRGLRIDISEMLQCKEFSPLFIKPPLHQFFTLYQRPVKFRILIILLPLGQCEQNYTYLWNFLQFKWCLICHEVVIEF